MKYNLLLLTLVAMILGIESLSKNQSKAEPASIFQPIIQDIRTKIPSSLQMRLPAFIPKTAKDTNLYSFIPDDDLNFINIGAERLDSFMVLFSKVPNCAEEKQPYNCTAGIIGVTETTSKSDLQVQDLPEDLTELTPISLNQSIKGFYFIQDEEYQFVIWKQDELAHLLITEQCEDRCLVKQDLIEMAKSAANQPPIINHDSSYHSY